MRAVTQSLPFSSSMGLWMIVWLNQMRWSPQNADGTPGAKNTKGYDLKANKGS